jgi:hypothetical protein
MKFRCCGAANRGRLGHPFSIQIGDEDGHSILRELFGYCYPDAHRGAGDERNLAILAERHCPLRLCVFYPGINEANRPR